jgi:hypothetical protein
MASMTSMISYHHDDMILDLKWFCQLVGIETIGICAYSIQENRNTFSCSIIIDWTNNIILTHYPSVFVGEYEEKQYKKLLICYKINLPRVLSNNNDYEYKPIKNDCEIRKTIGITFPCCEQMVEYRNIKTAYDEQFYDFKLQSPNANYEKFIFEVKRQINNGPLLDKAQYALKNGTRYIMNGVHKQKKHAYKNYICTKCNLFFGVDLCLSSNENEYNHYHLRLNPYTTNPQNLCSIIHNAMKSKL